MCGLAKNPILKNDFIVAAFCAHRYAQLFYKGVDFVVSYSTDYQREAGILKIEFFSKNQNPSRRRYSRHEEAYLQSTKSQ